MDLETIRGYDAKAADFAREWEDEQPAPEDLRAALRRFFRPGPSVDVGCGSGRDAAWLAETGFDVLGVDASEGLLAEARRRHPGVRFQTDSLPALATLKSGAYANVLCETVIMHLDARDIAAAVRRLVALLMPGGTLYLSWRVTRDGDQRDAAGRLYSSFDAALVRPALAGTAIELDEEIVSASSSKIVHRLVARRA
jgi:2-polyprenyl-3-methyl-5-hydroxy-6-metoxy-1,4-benzoquinol methylase